jgi:hypothetical protein
MEQAHEEGSLRRQERRLRRQSEDLAAKRGALAERLRRLEVEQVAPSSPDNLRDLERKVDALCGEVKELRRSVERQARDPRKEL